MTPPVLVISTAHVVILVIVLVLVFGASKLPDIARNVGKSARVLKEELTDSDNRDDPAAGGDTTPGAGITK